MSTVVMHNVVSVDGYIADENDEVGPLFDWYFNGDHPLVAGEMDGPAPGGRVIARVVAQGPSAAEPILSRLARDTGIEAAILAGRSTNSAASRSAS